MSFGWEEDEGRILEQHLVCVFVGGRFVIAQRGNSPELELSENGQGAKIFAFITDPFYEQLALAIREFWAVQAEEGNSFSLTTGTVEGESSPGMLLVETLVLNISRVAAGMKPFPIHPNFQLGFANNLECTWAYLIDLDNNVFHIFFCHEAKHPGHLFESVGGPGAWVPRHIMTMSLDEAYSLRQEKGWDLTDGGGALPAFFQEIKKACKDARKGEHRKARKCPNEKDIGNPAAGSKQAGAYPPRPGLKCPKRNKTIVNSDDDSG
ncbi:hypothetical protein B0T22DRAFT_451031 [Podospora appendiculata]|uniref:Uncharacterized protein n=1 Tax=Podospora appendiculata TaxID=314037 RepID=A0AAE0XIA8_9PEZI|nr:hypothetical protein B0T22DRAFT_451031 [Podospora appendiculata]